MLQEDLRIILDSDPNVVGLMGLCFSCLFAATLKKGHELDMVLSLMVCVLFGGFLLDLRLL